MSQKMWGNKDQANNSPIWGPVNVMLTPNTVNRDLLYNNTTANAFVTNTAFSNGYIAGVFGVSKDEMNDATQGQVNSVTVTAAGSGYTTFPTVVFTGGGGSGATATATTKLVTVAIAPGGGGANYGAGNVVTVQDGTSTVAANVNVLTVNSSGGVLTVSVNVAGSYSALPTLANNVPTGGNGTGLKLDLSFGVNAVAMTANGNNYTSAPVVSFTGNGTGTVATATLRSEQSKIPAAGWTLRKVLPNGRVQYETLVAMKTITANGSGDADDTILPD